MDAYKILAECTLILTLIYNRKRVGDIQYMNLNSCRDRADVETSDVVQSELASSLTQNEKIVTQRYRRITPTGKGSRPVTILISKGLQPFFSVLTSLRTSQSWFSPQNTFLFTYPNSLRWIDGCSVIRTYAKKYVMQNILSF